MSRDRITIRPAVLDDLPRLTEIHNYFVLNTMITFDIKPYQPEERLPWFKDHSDGKRYRLFVAEHANLGVVGYACTGRHRAKEAYDTTVESTVYCSPEVKGMGVGKMLYQTLFDAIANEDIHQIVAGIGQPNDASNALHARFGFQPLGTFHEVGRKFGKYWDVMWLQRPLKLID